VQQARGQRQALLPSARQRAGELAAAIGQAEPLQRRLDARPALFDAIDARDEVEVFLDRQVLVQAKVLRHVSDAQLDAAGFTADVVAEAGALAVIDFEQPAQHADRRRLAATVRAEKAADLAARHLQIKVINYGAAAEGLGQAADIDCGA
jgi:hypothetical protein